VPDACPALHRSEAKAPPIHSKSTAAQKEPEECL
jgi:hypothetical protein